MLVSSAYRTTIEIVVRMEQAMLSGADPNIIRETILALREKVPPAGRLNEAESGILSEKIVYPYRKLAAELGKVLVSWVGDPSPPVLTPGTVVFRRKDGEVEIGWILSGAESWCSVRWFGREYEGGTSSSETPVSEIHVLPISVAGVFAL